MSDANEAPAGCLAKPVDSSKIVGSQTVSDQSKATDRKENSGNVAANSKSVGSGGTSSNELKKVLSVQYKFFASQFDYLHRISQQLSKKYNGLDILLSPECSSDVNESDSGCKRTQEILEAKKRFLVAIKDLRMRTSKTDKKKASHEMTEEEDQKQKEKGRMKSNRRLPQVGKF